MRILPLAILVLALAGLFAIAPEDRLAAGEKGKVKVGDKAPAFVGTDDQGKPWKSSDVVGKKVVVLFFFPAALTGG